MKREYVCFGKILRKTNLENLLKNFQFALRSNANMSKDFFFVIAWGSSFKAAAIRHKDFHHAFC